MLNWRIGAHGFVQPVTLYFRDSDLEQGYRRSEFEHSIQGVRLALLLGAVIHLCYLPLDQIMLGEDYRTMWDIRLGILIPNLILHWLSSFRPWFYRYHLIFGVTLALTNGLAMSFGTLLFGEATTMYFSPGTIMVTMYVYALVNLRVVIATLTAWCIVGVNIIVISFLDTPIMLFTNALEVLLISIGILTIGAYNKEWASRKAYYAGVQLLDHEHRKHEAEAVRIDWLENMARFLRHELRNTLVGVKTSLDLLQRRASLTEDDTHLVRARKGLRLIGHMLESVTQATSIESSFMKETPEPVAVDQVIREQVENYHEIYPDHQIELRSEGDEIRVRGREERIVQLLDKLVSNAVDHSKPNTPIVISCRKEGGKAILNVRNEGAPLPEDKTAMFDLFASFRQPSEDEGKRGIGLYVVRLIAERYGGRVMASDRSFPVGAEFSVVMPTL